MDKTGQLDVALGQLSAREAVALARAVEMQRLLGKEELPTDAVLAALRPKLRQARASRVPTLRRLVCQAFHSFLSDRADDPRLPGLVSRAAIKPWWQGLRHIARAEIDELEERLRGLLGADASNSTERLMHDAQAAAAGWTRTMLEQVTAPKGDANLRKLFQSAQPIADLKQMAELLEVAEPLGRALAAVEQILPFSENGAQILELTPDAITAAKQHYLALAEEHGVAARFLPLSLVNRLTRPQHVLRLGRALSWKGDDSLVRGTEFAVVGERLILDLQCLAQDVLALVARPGHVPSRATLAGAVLRYMEDAEGLVGEFGFRRDNPWGEAILRTRMQLANVLGRDFLDRMAEQAILGKLLPLDRRSGKARGGAGEPDLSAPPDPADIEEAVATAQFFALLLNRGSRHGFAQAARAAVDALGAEMEKRAAALLEVLRRSPVNSTIEAQIDATVRVLDVLFEDGRGALLERRMRVANQAGAAAAG